MYKVAISNFCFVKYTKGRGKIYNAFVLGIVIAFRKLDEDDKKTLEEIVEEVLNEYKIKNINSSY